MYETLTPYSLLDRRPKKMIPPTRKKSKSKTTLLVLCYEQNSCSALRNYNSNNLTADNPAEKPA